MACDRDHAHLLVFAHACGYYSRAATNRGATSIRINTVDLIIFFKATRTLSRKKIVQKPPYNRAGCIVEPYNASRQPKFQVCQKIGKGRHVYVRAWPRPSRSAWAETLQTHGFPVQTYGKLQRAVTLFLRRESKFFQVKSLISAHSACPCKNYPPQVFPTPPMN